MHSIVPLLIKIHHDEFRNFCSPDSTGNTLDAAMLVRFLDARCLEIMVEFRRCLGQSILIQANKGIWPRSDGYICMGMICVKFLSSPRSSRDGFIPSLLLQSKSMISLLSFFLSETWRFFQTHPDSNKKYTTCNLKSWAQLVRTESHNFV